MTSSSAPAPTAATSVERSDTVVPHFVPRMRDGQSRRNSDGDLLGFYKEKFVKRVEWYIISYEKYELVENPDTKAVEKKTKASEGILLKTDNPYFDEILQTLSVEREDLSIRYRCANMQADENDFRDVDRLLAIKRYNTDEGETRPWLEQEKMKAYFNGVKGCSDNICVLWQNMKLWLKENADKLEHPERYSTSMGVGI